MDSPLEGDGFEPSVPRPRKRGDRALLSGQAAGTIAGAGARDPQNQQRGQQASGDRWTDIMQGGMTPKAAAEKAFKRVEEIFSKYPIEQS